MQFLRAHLTPFCGLFRLLFTSDALLTRLRSQRPHKSRSCGHIPIGAPERASPERIREMTQCGSCGSPLPAGVRLCMNCGALAPEKRSPYPAPPVAAEPQRNETAPLQPSHAAPINVWDIAGTESLSPGPATPADEWSIAGSEAAPSQPPPAGDLWETVEPKRSNRHAAKVLIALGALAAALVLLWFVPWSTSDGDAVAEETREPTHQSESTPAIAPASHPSPAGASRPSQLAPPASATGTSPSTHAATSIPTSFGVSACDAYVRMACACRTEGLCESARRDFEELRDMARNDSMRTLVNQACRGHILTIADAC
jgi:hypothetical protein